MAFLEFAHILWEATKPTIVLTDNKSVTRFFQTKTIPPALWNACEYVLQFNFKVAHFAGSVNTAPDSLCRLELKVTEKVRLKIREKIQTTTIEVTTYFSVVSEEEQFFFTQADNKDDSEDQIPTGKKIQTKCEAMGSKRGTISPKNKCGRIYRDRREHHVVFHAWNQGKCTNTSRARCRSGVEVYETENSRPAT